MKSKSLILFSFSLLSALFLVGCGKTGTGNPTLKPLPKLNGAEYLPLDKAGLDTTSETKVAGTGSLIFKNPRPSDDSNFQITFQLEPQSLLTLVTNANENLEQGVSITFTRPAANKTLRVTAKVGNKDYDYSIDFAARDASAPLTFSVDVHGHGHIIFYDGNNKEQEYATPAVGAKFYGLILNKATVTKFVAGKEIGE